MRKKIGKGEMENSWYVCTEFLSQPQIVNRTHQNDVTELKRKAFHFFFFFLKK